MGIMNMTKLTSLTVLLATTIATGPVYFWLHKTYPASSTTETTATIGTTETNKVKAAIQATLPRTHIDAVNPSPVDGLYEVVTKNNLYYTDGKGQFVVVGGIFDPRNSRDLTADRKRELKITDRTTAASGEEKPEKRTNDGAGSVTAKVNQETLRAIDPYTFVLHDGGKEAPVVYAIYDPACGYCSKEYSEIKAENTPITLKAILVPNLSEPTVIHDFYCSTDPLKAIDNFANKHYVIPGIKADCDDSGLKLTYQKLNETFSSLPMAPNGAIRQLGTPILIDAVTGTVIEGYKPAKELLNIITQLSAQK